MSLARLLLASRIFAASCLRLSQTPLDEIAYGLLNHERGYYQETMQHVDNRRNFRDNNIGTFEGTLFYPFAGGDILTGRALFESASTIVMTALFDAGPCDVQSWSATAIANRQTSINTLLGKGSLFSQHGYFATVQMDQQLQQTGYGITPLLLASLKLMGYRIQGVQCGSTLGQGKFHETKTTNVVKIFYNKENADANAAPFELVYAKLDMLPTPGTAEATQLTNFLNAITAIGSPVAAMMKAAAYLIRMTADLPYNGPGRDGHHLDSTILGNWIKDSTAVVLQDDTAMSTQCFTGWQMTVFGIYLGPTPLIETPADAASQVDNYLHNVASGDGHCGFRTDLIQHADLTIHFGYGVQYAIDGCPSLPVSTQAECLHPNGQWGGNGAVPVSRYITSGIAMLLVKNGYNFNGMYMPPAAKHNTSGTAAVKRLVQAAPNATMLD
eukprot:gnl/TRDRNA2_/TRDRNA2_166194_c0_seq4.p1 gnl/TRDRNA2_/TRDRNA2_166194_c0~~gnl/TRDRNA2_/TRDRNA2_166194_c0_seq4.p1  ORF type:complete len:441 (-),score=56.88 gnl/TRDRNA2_/TRDRNA2_166194_c0_seq4:31-1353(-)